MCKIRKIEFLRVFIIIAIVMMHMFLNRPWCLNVLCPDIDLYKFLHLTFAKSNNGVDGFFIIAGFLLVLTFKKQLSLLDFMWKKYIRLAPVVIFSIVICAVGNVVNVMSFKFTANMLTILMLNNAGIFWVNSANHVLWYTSVIFWALVVYFCLKKYLKEKYFLITSFCIILLSYTILEILQRGVFAHPAMNYYRIFNIGFLRGLAGVGIGTILGQFYVNNIDRITQYTPNLCERIVFTIGEVVSFGFVFWWMCIRHVRINNIVYVIIFVVLFSLFVAGKGYLSKLLEKEIWVKLGRYQYSVYVMHYIVIKDMGILVWQKHLQFVHAHQIGVIAVNLVLIIIISAIAYHFVETPCTKYFLKNNGKK